MSRPPAVDRQRSAGDRSRRVAGEEDGQRAQLFHAGKMLVGLLRQQHVVNDFFARDAVRLGLAVDLRFDQRGIDIAGADRVARNALFRRLERGDFRQADDAMLGRDIGRLEG